MHSLLEGDRPFIRLLRMPSPCVCMQVMYEVAAAHDQNAFFPERRKARADFITRPERLLAGTRGTGQPTCRGRAPTAHPASRAAAQATSERRRQGLGRRVLGTAPDRV